MNKFVSIASGVVIAAVALLAYLSAFTVDMTQQALVLQFSAPREVVSEPGLHWKLPFVQNVVYIDKRLLTLETAKTEEIIAKDRKRLVVDAFARFKIIDPLKFYKAIGDPRYTEDRLQPNFVAALRNVIGDNSLEELVRDNRAGLMLKIRDAFNKAASEFGIEVVDVRIRRADLPEANSQAIYRRMQTEREREAAELRAQGQENAQRIRSRADRDVTVLLADAERDAQIARGEGDATQNKIYAEAYSKDPEFFAFYRSMQAYKESMKGSNTTMVITPDSEFFRYFENSTGTAPRK